MKHPSKAFEITVNGATIRERREAVYYMDLVALAYGLPTPRGRLFTITYRHGPRKNPSGSLAPGEKPVWIGHGMIFNVAGTGAA